MSGLGKFLQTAREARGLTLRAVESATEISNAHLSQLETGRIRKPSPNVLHTLCELYGVRYDQAMRLAGYPFPTEQHAAPAFSRFDDLTDAEETALTEYLAFLRTRRRKPSP